MDYKDTAKEYKAIKEEINKLEDKLINIKEEISNYRVPFGKYRGKTLAEIAHLDTSYYKWLKAKKLIPYTINIEINIYIMGKVQNCIESGIAAEYARRKEEQGYVGRYII